jgi:hypothetical protein
MAFDVENGKVVLFGGYAAGTIFNDTWTWDGRARHWTQQFPKASPSARRAPIAYDRATEQIVLFGGDDGGPNQYNDTWTWNGSTWTLVTTTSVPTYGRFAFGMDYDPIARGPVIFGGFSTGFALLDTWVLAPLPDND